MALTPVGKQSRSDLIFPNLNGLTPGFFASATNNLLKVWFAKFAISEQYNLFGEHAGFFSACDIFSCTDRLYPNRAQMIYRLTNSVNSLILYMVVSNIYYTNS